MLKKPAWLVWWCIEDHLPALGQRGRRSRRLQLLEWARMIHSLAASHGYVFGTLNMSGVCLYHPEHATISKQTDVPAS